MVSLMATFRRVYTEEDLPSLLLPVSRPCAWPLPTHTSPGEPHPSRWFRFSLLWSCCSFPLGLGVCVVWFVPSKTGVSVPPVLWKSCNQIPLAFHARFPRDFQSLCQIQAGKPDVKFTAFTRGGNLNKWEDFFGVIVLQFVGHLHCQYGI